MAGAELTTQRGTHPGDGHGASGHAVQHGHASHPTARFYIGIFVILFVVTLLEVFVAQEPLLGMITGVGVPVLVPLLILAAAKFLMIAGFYMHLKQDSRVFTAFFAIGLILAIGMLFTFMGLFAAHSREPFNEIAWRDERVAQSGGGTSTTGTAGGGH